MLGKKYAAHCIIWEHIIFYNTLFGGRERRRRKKRSFNSRAKLKQAENPCYSLNEKKYELRFSIKICDQRGSEVVGGWE